MAITESASVQKSLSEWHERRASFYEDLNDSGHSVGDVIPNASDVAPDTHMNTAPIYQVVADGRGRLWRFSYADGGSYKLIFDPGI